MARPRPPKIDPSSPPKFSEDHVEKHLEASEFRLRNLLAEMEKGTINAPWVAFEWLQMMFPVLADGVPPDQVQKYYPVKSWRDPTVEVPSEVLAQLLLGWTEYAKSGKTLGQSFGFEPLNRQGASSMKKKVRQVSRQISIAGAVYKIHVDLGDSEASSKENAISVAAERMGVSESTARRAYEDHMEHIHKTTTALYSPNRKPFKTSRSDDMDEPND